MLVNCPGRTGPGFSSLVVKNLLRTRDYDQDLATPKSNKAIVDYTSPALYTPVTPFPPIGDAAYCQYAGLGPSREHRQHAQKIRQRSRVWFRRYPRGQIDNRQIQTDIHTQTDILITIHRNRSGARSKDQDHKFRPIFITFSRNNK